MIKMSESRLNHFKELFSQFFTSDIRCHCGAELSEQEIEIFGKDEPSCFNCYAQDWSPGNLDPRQEEVT